MKGRPDLDIGSANGWYNKSGYDPRIGGCYLLAEVVDPNVWLACGTIENAVYVYNGPSDHVYDSDNGPFCFAVWKGRDK